MEEAILCTGPTCLTIKKRYPPYIAGLFSWIYTSFLALLLLLEKNFVTDPTLCIDQKRLSDTIYPLPDLSQSIHSNTALHVFLGYYFTSGNHRTENKPARKRCRAKQSNKLAKIEQFNIGILLRLGKLCQSWGYYTVLSLNSSSQSFLWTKFSDVSET